MSEPTQIDHVEIGLSRVLSQWENSEKLKGLIQSYLEQSNSVEDILFQLLNERSIFTAVGAQLDIIGALFGIGREGRTDDGYRNAILQFISILGADGTTEVFMQALRSVSGSDFVDFWEHPSGDVHALLGAGYDVFTYPALEDLVSAGVSLRIYVDDEFDSFQASELLQQVSDLQTNAGEDIQVTPDGVALYDLQVQQNEIDDIEDTLAVLPEIVDDIETPYFAELLFTPVNTITGQIVDDLGNFLIDDLQNDIIWVDYEF